MSTRDRIIEEAAQMFRTYGIRAVTMDMLAAQMGISKRTIYEVFRDKDELLKGVMMWMSSMKSQLIDRCLESSSNVIEATFMIMDIMMEHYKKMSPAFKLDMKKHHNDMIKFNADIDSLPQSDSKQILIEGVKQGVFRSDLDIDLTDRCLRGMTKMNEKEIPEDFDNEDMIRNFFVNYLRGISTQKGLELIDLYDRRKGTTGNNRNLQI
ncbi:MAG TPA: TetR/AcrR family transcriptional regulator [Bacteroidales bacterium]|nr:TetR/AcrR family transcriptional regulator [Bacteroidales bacterium]